MNNHPQKIIDNQSGKIISWALLIVTAVWTLLYVSFNELTKIHFISEYLIYFQSGLIVVSWFFLVFAFQASKQGRFNIRGNKGFAKKIQTHFERMNEIIEENERILYQIQLEAKEKSLKLSHTAHSRIKAAEGLISDLKLRSKKIDQNMRSGSNANLIAADSLIRLTICPQARVTKRDPYESPQQALDDTSAKLKRIIKEIQIEQKKI